MNTIRDAYISIEIKDQNLGNFRSGLQSALRDQGLSCEAPAADLHVSIAYGQGEIGMDRLSETVREIARRGFMVRAKGFEILEGRSTPYDYLVIALESSGAIQDAVSTASGRMATKRFAGGFKSHVSLLRFAKGSICRTALADLIRELNASHGAAFALGRYLCLEGDSIRVYNPEMQCCLQVAIRAACAQAA